MGVRRFALPEPVKAARIGNLIYIADSVAEEDVAGLLDRLRGGQVVVLTADRRFAAEGERTAEGLLPETEEREK
jgi:hypothetical protein